MNGSPPVRAQVVVVGGGIAGLAAALRVRDTAPAGTRITVVEQAGTLGGKLRTGEAGGATLYFQRHVYAVEVENSRGKSRRSR
jgi:oxygen-dependent protoporphyrinogen oxidase